MKQQKKSTEKKLIEYNKTQLQLKATLRKEAQEKAITESKANVSECEDCQGKGKPCEDCEDSEKEENPTNENTSE